MQLSPRAGEVRAQCMESAMWAPLSCAAVKEKRKGGGVGGKSQELATLRSSDPGQKTTHARGTSEVIVEERNWWGERRRSACTLHGWKVPRRPACPAQWDGKSKTGEVLLGGKSQGPAMLRSSDPEDDSCNWGGGAEGGEVHVKKGTPEVWIAMGG
jgi:hypothetical protein